MGFPREQSLRRTRILVCALSVRTHPVVSQLTYWIHGGERGSLGFTHDGEDDRTMAVPYLRI